VILTEGFLTRRAVSERRQDPSNHVSNEYHEILLVRRTDRKADYSPPSSAPVKDECSHVSTSIPIAVRH